MKNLQSVVYKETKLSLCETCFYGYFYVGECDASLPDYIQFKQKKLYRQKLKDKACKEGYCCYYKRYLRTFD